MESVKSRKDHVAVEDMAPYRSHGAWDNHGRKLVAVEGTAPYRSHGAWDNHGRKLVAVEGMVPYRGDGAWDGHEIEGSVIVGSVFNRRRAVGNGTPRVNPWYHLHASRAYPAYGGDFTTSTLVEVDLNPLDLGIQHIF